MSDTTKNGIGTRIKRVRLARGLSQDALAAAIGATKSTISKIESGMRKVEGGELADLADVLGVSMRDLVGRRQPLGPLALANRLGASDPTSPTASEAQRRVRQLLELEAMLDELEIPAPIAPAASFELVVPSTSDGVRAGREAAAEVRSRVGMGDAPVGDLASLLEKRFGIDVVALPLGDGPDTISGLCVRSGATRIALVNSSKVPTHQRFTLAHELAHLLFDDPDHEVHVDEHVGSGAVTDPREVRANVFAAAFLMPEEAIASVVGDQPMSEATFAHLLFTLDVSVTALVNRIADLRIPVIVPLEHLRESTPKQFAWRHNRVEEWARSNEPRHKTRPPTKLYERALAAYGDGRIGVGPLAGLLDRDEDELARELDEAGISPNLLDDADVLELL